LKSFNIETKPGTYFLRKTKWYCSDQKITK